MKQSFLARTRVPAHQPVHDSQRRGTASVEFALSVPLLLLLFVAGVDFGRVYYDVQVIADCAREGALYAANPDIADRTDYETVEEATLAGATGLKSQPTVKVTYGTDELSHQYAEVAVTHTFKTVSGFIRPSEFQITRKSRARLYPAAIE